MLRCSLILLLIATTGCVKTVSQRAQHAHPAWSYNGAEGPGHWAENYPDCALPGGSPIDITNAVPADLPPLLPDYQRVSGRVRDTGHTIQVDAQDGTLRLGERSFNLVQFHFHIPGEHRYNGSRYEASMHLVHADAAGRLTVVDVPVTSGSGSPMIDLVLSELEKTEAARTTLNVKPASTEYRAPSTAFSSGLLLPDDLAYYSYDGSLTTPPCSGGVLWIVLSDPVTWSPEQIQRLDSYYHGNARPVEPLGDRKVLWSGN